MAEIIVNQNLSDSPFDFIRRTKPDGAEFWYARELMELLGYKHWHKFKSVIKNAQENLEAVGIPLSSCLLPVELLSPGRTALDYELSRIACYHIALSCDSRGNESVKRAKHYFAVKTREAETIIPFQNERLQEIQLINENMKLELRKIELSSSMIVLHGKELGLTILGKADQLVQKETVVTEIVNPQSGNCTKILTADQLKKAVKEKAGQNVKSLKWFADKLRAAGRDDLLIPVTRHSTNEYLLPEALDEAIAIVYGKERQQLIGES